MPIAIVGIGCRFPGGIVDAESFWRVLADGVDAITEIPASRFDIGRLYDARPATPGRIMSRLGGYLDRLEEFDAAFFGISPVQAERMDPQQRLLLETAWEALEDAGEDIGALAGSRTGVFVGQWVSDFENRLFADPQGIDFPMTLGSGRYAASGRISYAFGFRGPSLTLDAACSSSLAAVHLAVRSLRDGDGDVALAGGVNIILQPHIHLAYSQSRMMAPDGRCKFGDVSGDGYVRAEGAAIVVLKPLATALADGDRVYAVIRGSAVNNDGDSSGSMGRPSRVGQEELVRSALADARMDPARIGYVEAHGTGTRAGDPVELDALTAVLGARAPGDRAWVGSVKTNFGHTEAAAGVAGLIKATLALHHGMVPPSLHFRDPNPAIAWGTVPFAIPTALTEWPRGAAPRVAGVSSYGIGGTNAHVLLEEAPTAEAPVSSAEAEAGPALLPLSARSVAAARALAARYAELLERHPEHALRDVCWSAATRRTVLTDRAAFVATDRAAMVEALRAYAAGAPATAEGTSHERGRPKVAFVVPGQGAQWAGMAREMAAQEPVFRAALEECDAAARPYASWSILEQLALDPGAPGYLGDRIDVIQPVLVAIAIAYARWLRSIGIAPDAVVGHSMGEVGAAEIAGVLDTAQAMRIICRRSALMLRTSGQGTMAVVELSMAEAEARVAAHAGRLSVAVSNAPRSTVISGDPAAVQQVVADLERDGVFARLVKVDVASHSPQMDPLAAELRAELADLAPAAGTLPMYSTVAGAMLPGADFDAAYWARNLRQPVRFADAVGRLLDDGVSVFVELGPHPVLTQAVQQNAAASERPVTAIVCGRRNESDRLGAYAAVAALWVAGAGPTWSRLMPAGRTVPLPLYAWQRETYWVDAAQPARADGAPRARPALSDEQRGWLYVPRWEPAPMASGAPRRVLLVGAPAELRLPAAESVATVAEAARQAAGSAADGREIDIVLVVDPADATPAWNAVDALRTLQAAWPAGRPAPRLWWATTGAQRVADETPSPRAAEQGAVWGAARVIATEHPDWWGGLIDLDPSLPLAAQRETLARHLAAKRTEDQVALRGGSRFALRLTRAASSLGATPASFQWRADGAYLVTGGFGGIAQRVATEMVRQGARRLVLLGRTALPPRASWGTLPPDSPAGQRVAFVRALEHTGASVHVLHADVTDQAQLRAALDGYQAEGWPPIVGVLHTAGVLDTRLTHDMDAAAFARVLEPKLAGAVALDRLLPELDLFVAFSSMMAFWAPPGEANYSAANAGLDALVQARRARGQHGLAIQWGPWTDVGMWQGATGDRSMEALAREGVRSFSAAEGVAFLAPLLSAAAPVVAVVPVDWATFAAARRGRPSPLFQYLVDAVATAEQATADSGLPAQLREASPLARRALVDTLVRATLGAVLRRPAEGIDATRPFGTMGLDSLMALDLRNRLEAALERPLPATLAWNYPTVAQLGAHLETLFADVAPEPTPEPVAAPADTGFSLDSLFDDLTLLSDEDAARALRGGR